MAIQFVVVTYTNVAKTMLPAAQGIFVGEKLAFDFYISDQRVQTTGCDVPSPVTYELKVMEVVTMAYVP